MPEKKRKAAATKTAKPSATHSVVKKKRAAQEPSVRHAASGTRVLQAPKRVWQNPLTWRNHPPVPAYKPLPKARKLFWNVLRQLWADKKLFGGIVAIYGLLDIVLVRGLSGSNNLSSIKSSLDGLTSGVGGELASSFVSFGYLLTNSGSSNASNSGPYQSILLLVCSLAFIWALRQTLAEHKVRVRDSFYRGMYPLIPFLLVLLMIGLQLLPLAIGGGLYSTVISNGIAVHLWEKTLWAVLFAGLGIWSLRMITASVFALYIVTLPDMTPLRAYRNARQLVYGRRLLVWRKLIFLPVMLLLLAIVIELPLILFLTPVAVWTFFIFSMVTLPVVHGYLYNLYREML